MSKREHWQAVYETKAPTEVSWYAEHLGESLELIRSVSSSDARVVDVGGGASTLVDDLLAAGYRNLTVLDISSAALEVAQVRLGERAELVQWVSADIVSTPLPENSFDVWHDRAVFHFLTQESDRRAYVEQVRRSVAPGGHVVLGTFSLEGPTQCSGLDVMRYDAASLAATLGSGFALKRSFVAQHVTPAGREQSFQYCVFGKLG